MCGRKGEKYLINFYFNPSVTGAAIAVMMYHMILCITTEQAAGPAVISTNPARKLLFVV